MTNPKLSSTDNPHIRLVEEIKRKRPECVAAFRALLDRKIAERKLRGET